nr:T9SS type A sorting domain-containing protein [Bacteroidota bacterium]
MKKSIIFIFTWIFLKTILANPIPVPPVISEIYLSGGAIQIEFYFDEFWWFESFDELRLISSTDTVEFLEGIDIQYNEIMVLNNSHLQETLNVNPQGDFIDIIEAETGFTVGPGPIGFGNYNYAFIPAPGENQSMAYEKQYNWEYGYYDYILSLEQPPSIGLDPFHVQARGCLAGYIVDLGDHPVPGAQIYDVFTDDEGYFIKTDMLSHLYFFLRIYYNGIMFWDPEDFLIQPYDTCLRVIQIDTLLTGLSDVKEPLPSISNSPNPFLNTTTFEIALPGKSNYKTATLCIYDMKGKLIEKMDLMNFPSEISWNSVGYDTGIYFYNLVLDNKSFAGQKMIKL